MRVSFRVMVIAVLLSGLGLAYIYQHSYSVKITKELRRLETEKRLALEQVESIDVQLKRLQSFCRLESIYLSASVQVSLPGESVVDVSPVSDHFDFRGITLVNFKE